MKENPAKHIWLDPLSTTFKKGQDCNQREPILKYKDMSFLLKYVLVKDKNYKEFLKFKREHP